MKISVALKAEAAALSPAQKEYRSFFKKRLKDAGVSHPFEDDDKAADFFSGLSDEWAKHKEEKGL